MTNDVAACNQAGECIGIMMRQLQSLWPQNSGFEWNLTKLHKQFHVPVDIHCHGRQAPQRAYWSPTAQSSNLLLNMHPKTQLNRRKLDKQTGKRVVDGLIIQCGAYDRGRPPDLPPACAQKKAPAMLQKQYSCFGRCQMTGSLMPTANLCGKVRNTNILGYCYMMILCFF